MAVGNGREGGSRCREISTMQTVIPRKSLTDQGSNFQSQLLCDLYWLLHIDALCASPYHPQTDGLVERFNQTLNRMLKKQHLRRARTGIASFRHYSI